MPATTSPPIDVQILETIVAPQEPTLPVSLARALLKLSLRPDQQAEIDNLLDRNNDGTITPAERERLEGYVRVGNLLSLLQAKARASVSRRGRSS